MIVVDALRYNNRDKPGDLSFLPERAAPVAPFLTQTMIQLPDICFWKQETWRGSFHALNDLFEPGFDRW